MEIRKSVTAAATALFRAKGLRFTMQEVADSLHISKKTIYTIYSSKEELLLDMVDELFADIHREKQRLISSLAPVEERVRAVIIAMPEQFRTIDFRMLDMIDEKYPALSRRVREHLENNWEPTIALIEEGIEQGRIRPVSIPVLRQIITASIVGFLSDSAGEQSYADTLSAMMDIIMNGLRRYDNEI